jgi:hypothetical protein
MSINLTNDNVFNANGSKHASVLLLSVGWVSGNGVKNHASTVNPETHLLMEV